MKKKKKERKKTKRGKGRFERGNNLFVEREK